MNAVPHSYRLSLAQERLWFLEQLQPGTALYNLPFALRCCGTLDVQIMRAVLNELVIRHSSLRTRFVAINGVGHQVVDLPGEMTFAFVDLDGDRAELSKLVTAEAIRPFDLSTGPVVRAVLFRLDGCEHVLLLSMHHIVSDGRSMSVLMRELRELYLAYSCKDPSTLKPLALQYADYSEQEQKLQQGLNFGLQLEYWRDRLIGAPPLDLPYDYPRPALQSYCGASHRFEIPGALVARLRKISKQGEVTLFTVLAAAYQALLSRWSGQHDIVVGLPVSGRCVETEGLVGFFVNILVLRTDFYDDPEFSVLVQRVRMRLMEAYSNQNVPFEKVVQAVQPARDMSRHPIFQASLNYRALNFSPYDMGDLVITAERLSTNTVKCDLDLNIEMAGDTLICRLDFATDLFEANTIKRLTGNFLTLLDAVAEQPDTSVSQLSLLSEAEKRQLLIEWNNTAGEHHAVN